MSLLSVKERQALLQDLGFYDGEIDGKVGPLTKNAYLKLQACYFDREKDIDGKYGKDTNTLLLNAYNVKKHCKNFKLSEFRCGCGRKHCTGYPAVLDVQLLKNLQSIRSFFGKTIITSGLRCKKHNKSLVGSSSTSRHLSGKAVDFKGEYTSSVAYRRNVISYLKDLCNFRYAYCNINGSHPNMGTAIHFDVK